MEKTERTEWIDAIRGLGILSIIIFHTGFLPFIQISNPLLMNWALPVFVFTGGWLLKNTPFTKNRSFSFMKRLFIPFFLSGSISFGGWLLLRQIYPQHVLTQPIGNEIIKWLTGRSAFFNSPLWFIPTYVIASSVMQIIATQWFRLNIIIRTAISISCIVLGFLLSKPYTYPVFSYDLVVLFIGMMMMGSVASTINIPTYVLSIPYDILSIILFLILTLSNGYVDMFQRQFRNEFLYVICALLGTYCVARLLPYGKNTLPVAWKQLTQMGTSSMSLLVWHWPIMQWLTYGLFTTGVLQTIAATYTKTSFTVKQTGFQLLALQIFFCILYTCISLMSIHLAKKLLRNKQKYTSLHL
jgi:fucose 4-O-acetylase-like acetyltransferase